ncbi:MAG: SDR family oxidoreductase, partial [Chloroflexi bacterium]
MGRAHAHDAGARSRSEARRVVGDDGAGLRPQLAAASRRIRAGMSSVVVTGAAKGIGAGIVEAFAKAGWSVVAVDRDKAPLEQTVSRIGANIVTLAGDVADRGTNDAAVKMAVDRFGGLDAA